MKVYVVCHEETGDYIGHGLYDTYTVIDGIYKTREAAQKAADEDEDHDYWVNEKEVNGEDDDPSKFSFVRLSRVGRCPHCRTSVFEATNPSFCGNCGNRIEWE